MIDSSSIFNIRSQKQFETLALKVFRFQFENNSISGSSRFPILVDQDLISDMDLGSCSFSENGTNMVGMHQETSDRLNTMTTL